MLKYLILFLLFNFGTAQTLHSINIGATFTFSEQVELTELYVNPVFGFEMDFQRCGLSLHYLIIINPIPECGDKDSGIEHELNHSKQFSSMGIYQFALNAGTWFLDSPFEPYHPLTDEWKREDENDLSGMFMYPEEMWNNCPLWSLSKGFFSCYTLDFSGP